LFAVGLHTCTAVARSLCVSWAFLLSRLSSEIFYVNFGLLVTTDYSWLVVIILFSIITFLKCTCVLNIAVLSTIHHDDDDDDVNFLICLRVILARLRSLTSVDTSVKLLYRVAQNKIPQRTLCNFSATSCPIFFGKFLKLLNPDIYLESNSMQGTHHILNYTTTLPCKALTMKITIFTGGFLSASEIREGLFTDENNFFLKPRVKHQNDRVWSAGKKKMWTKVGW